MSLAPTVDQMLFGSARGAWLPETEHAFSQRCYHEKQEHDRKEAKRLEEFARLHGVLTPLPAKSPYVPSSSLQEQKLHELTLAAKDHLYSQGAALDGFAGFLNVHFTTAVFKPTAAVYDPNHPNSHHHVEVVVRAYGIPCRRPVEGGGGGGGGTATVPKTEHEKLLKKLAKSEAEMKLLQAQLASMQANLPSKK